MNDARLGVFICDCGDQIASILDMDSLEQGACDLPGVACVQRLRYSCSSDGLDIILSTAKEAHLDRVLVAGCTPRMQERHLRRACENAHLDGDLIELIDIREGCAWAHWDKPEAATGKALDLIRMGAARAAARPTRQPIHAEVASGVLVIGGGVAGMAAALTLANAGQPVTLVEREAALGGMLRATPAGAPDRRNGNGLAQQIEAVAGHPRIEVLLNSQVTDIAGTVGRYSIGFTHSGALRSGNGRRVDVGAIVVATGAHVRQPWGQFRYDGQRVVTQLEFERELQGAALPASVVMILCAGQRDEAVPYCSGVCCLGALRQALAVRAANPEASVAILFRDLYLLGDKANEKLLLQARQAGVTFIRYNPSSPPLVTADGVEVCDALTGGERHLSCERVVLATPLVPQPDASAVAHRLGIAQDKNGFFPEVHYRLRPESYAERGIYVAGAAHHPVDRGEAELQGISAALKALRHLRAGQVASAAPAAVVDAALCTGCANCVAPCPFGAISMHHRAEAVDLARIDPLLCTGCGNCVVVCPVKAIGQPVDGDAQVLAQIEAALAKPAPAGRPRILVFGCEWSGHAAAELAGANKLSYPVETRLIRVRCSARFDPIHVLWAFHNGADGVFLGACALGDCHYVDGNRYAQERIGTLRELLAKNGFDPRRLRLEWIVPDDAYEFVTKITGFADLVAKL